MSALWSGCCLFDTFDLLPYKKVRVSNVNVDVVNVEIEYRV